MCHVLNVLGRQIEVMSSHSSVTLSYPADKDKDTANLAQSVSGCYHETINIHHGSYHQSVISTKGL